MNYVKYAEFWDRFIDEVYTPFIDDKTKQYSEEQKNAIIAFAYDSEVNNGGHILFFDCFGDIFSINEVTEALWKIGGDSFALNFVSAAAHIHYTDDLGYIDKNEDADSDPEEDFIYYDMKPALPDLLEEYIYDNKESIFLNDR